MWDSLFGKLATSGSGRHNCLGYRLARSKRFRRGMEMAVAEDEEHQIIIVGDEELNEEAATHINRTLRDDETPLAAAGYDFETKLLVITDQRVLVTAENGVELILNHDDIYQMRRDGRTLIIETRSGVEHPYRFGTDDTVEELIDIAGAAVSLKEMEMVPVGDEDVEEQTESEGNRRGMLDKAKGLFGSAKQKISRSVDAVTGADIRRFDEFTDATTRAVVGVHQDLSELRDQAARTRREVDDIQKRQERLTERLDQLGQSVGRLTSLPPWIVGAAAVALLLSIVAVVMSVS